MAEEKKKEVLEEVLEDLESRGCRKKQEEAQNTASEEKEVEAEEKNGRYRI